MNTDNNGQMCDFACRKENACGECTLQGAQNMAEVVVRGVNDSGKV